MTSPLLRNIPSVNELLESPQLKGLVNRVSRNVVVTGVRSFLSKLRDDVQQAAADMKVPTPSDLAEHIAKWIMTEEVPPLRPVINATGILLHTGLGRAPLADDAIEAIRDVAGGYASVEVDVKTGERSQRVQAVEKLLRQLTGAEAAAVVNNNAGATLLALSALATGREVIVSRGQLIEIGGSYRLPEVMTASGARLREVGTTNKTRVGDYDAAISEQTAALMRVHTSNFVVCGFTEEASLEELVALGRKRSLPVIDDIGSGALIDFAQFGLKGEPMASASLKVGADLVLFSGDKLLGGPQCGIIIGRKDLVQKISKHPLMRALRVDKMTLAALAATLRLYQDDSAAKQSIPLLALLNTPLENLKNRAERLAPQIAATKAVASAEAVEGRAFLGGGSVPTQEIPTWCIAVAPAEKSVDELATALRRGSPSLFGRVQQSRLFLDLRSVLPRQDLQLVEAFQSITASDDQPEPPAKSSADSPAESPVE